MVGRIEEIEGDYFDCGLIEELKWSQPGYTYQKRNVVMISACKEFCSLNFMKGSLLKDT